MNLCAYCVEAIATTDDHVFPSSWYGDATPSIVQRWTVPSCELCNRFYSRIEEDVGLRLAASVDIERGGAAGVWWKFFRSVQASAGSNDKDARIRARRYQRVMSEMIDARDVVPTAVLSHSLPQKREAAFAIRVDAGDLNGLIAKFVRGSHCYLQHAPLPTVAEIDVFHGGESSLQAFDEQHTEVHELGPGIRVLRMHVSDEARYVALYAFRFWQQALFFAGVELKFNRVRAASARDC